MSRWPQSISASSDSTTDPWPITMVGFSLAFSTVDNLVSCVRLAGGRNSGLRDEMRRIRAEGLAGSRESRHDFGVHLVSARRNADRSEELPVVVADIAVVSHLAVFERLLHLADTVIEIQAAIEAKLALDLLEGHAIVAAVGVLNMFDLGVREMFTNFRGDISEGVIQIGTTHIKHLTADESKRRIHHVSAGGGDVAHMDERAPLGAVEERDRTFLMGLGRQQVHDEIEARTVGKAKYRGEAQNRRVEIFIARPQQCLYGIDLGLGVE